MTTPPHQSPPPSHHGVLFALGAYGIWGLFPAFWKLLSPVPPPDVLAYRVVFTLVTVLAVVAVRARWSELRTILANGRWLAVLFASTLCVSSNWLVFIDTVAKGNVLDASMGYFLNPLVNVALAVMLLGERLRPLQWGAVALATFGVVYLGFAKGTPPWVPLFLAASFGVYGLLRKKLPVGALAGLAVETALMTPFALGFIAWRLMHDAPFLGGNTVLAAALAASGPVTALPLIFFAAAASRMRYSTLGFFQYIAPTSHFLLAVLAYGEEADTARMLAFACIWAAILLYTGDSVLTARRSRS